MRAFTKVLVRPALSALGTLLTLSAAGPALAQGNAPPTGLQLEEVTVTARKVEENLMTVPIAITAFTAKDIEDTGIKQLTDVMRMTPNFNFVNQQGGSGRNDRSANALVFRGLTLANNVGISPGGQLFIDGAPVYGAQPPPMVDVARIEVLKGPQSAYFGRSTFSGALNFIMKEPGEDFGGKVSLEGSSDSSHDASLSLESPLFSDKLAGRITFRDFKRGGYYDNPSVTGGELGEQTTQSLSGSIVWRPVESLKIKFHGSLFEDDDGPPAQGSLKQGEFNGRPQVDGSCPSFTQLAPGTPSAGNPNGMLPARPVTEDTTRPLFGYYCGTLPGVDALVSLNPRILSGDYDTSPTATNNNIFNPNPNWLIFGTGFKKDGGIRRESSQADLRIDWEFGGGYTLSSLSATHFDKTMTLIDLNYRDARNIPNELYTPATAATRTPWRQFLLVSQGRLKDWSQELRIASPTEQRFRWTLGANYIEQFSPGGTVYGHTPAGPLFTAAIVQNETKTPSVFGGAYFDITDTITVGAEARYQEDELNQRTKIGTNGAPPTGIGAEPLNRTFTSFSPRVSIDWKYAPNSTVYALYSKGTRPGGFNSALVTSTPATVAQLLTIVPSARVAYNEEELENIEVGLKSTWLDGRARTQLTLFMDEWADGQVATSIPVVAPGGVANLISLTVNTGTADIFGVEFEGEIRATENLRLMASIGYNDTEIKTFSGGPNGQPACLDCNFIYGSYGGVIGNRLPTVPEISGSLSADYSHRLTDTLDWYGRADYTYQGEKYTDYANRTKVGDSQLATLRLGVRNEKLTVEGFVTNLFDDDTVLSALLGVDVLTFLTPANKNEVRFSPPIPRQYGLRVTYDF
jgi:iron complex outermembrane receptor protein